jgi:hypothetical protein
MGGVTGIFHASRDPSIASLVLDSPFSSLKVLAGELVQNYTPIPKMIGTIARKFVRKSILSKAGFDIDELNPVAYVDKCFCPALIMTASGDDFVMPHHGKLLYDKYSGDKNIISVEGDHNSDRP